MKRSSSENIELKKAKTTVLVDDLFKKHPISTQFKIDPELEYGYYDIIKPKEPRNDQTEVFEIKTGKDEYVSFPTHHLFVETTTAKVVLLNSVETYSLLMNSDHVVTWPTAMSGINVFKEVEIIYQSHIKDSSNDVPLAATFLSNWAAQDLTYNSNIAYQELQQTYGNKPFYNHSMNFYKQDLTNANTAHLPSRSYHDITHLKLHESTTDAPSDMTTIDASLAGGTALHGKLHSITLPYFPFTPTTKYLQDLYNLPNKILLPPYTYLKIILYKTTIPYLNILNNKTITLEQNTKNTTINYDGPVKRVEVKINNCYMQVERFKKTKHSVNIDKHLSCNYSYNKVDCVQLNNHTTQSYNLTWPGNRMPEYAMLYFLRDYDFIFSNLNLTISNDKFLLPEHMDEIKLSLSEWNTSSTFNGFHLKELSSMKRDESKLNYMSYLKLNGFLPNTLPYNEYWSEEKTSGFQNCFPVRLAGHALTNNIISRGFDVLLKYSQPNNTNWYLIVRWVFLSTVDLTNGNGDVAIAFNE